MEGRNVRSSFKQIVGAAIVVFTAALAVVSIPAKAGEADAFHAAQHEAYGHYREALFYARRGNPSAAFELEAAHDQWADLVTRFGAAPPAPYDTDPQWKSTLETVGGHMEKALVSAGDDDLKAAWAQLKPVRGLLRDLRRRSKVVLFADHVDTANLTFQALFHFRRNPPDFNDAAQVKDLETRLAATIAAYERCRKMAPPDVAANDQFQRLLKDSLFYLDRMKIAIAEKNQLSVVNILRRVISSNNLLWLRFG